MSKVRMFNACFMSGCFCVCFIHPTIECFIVAANTIFDYRIIHTHYSSSVNFWMTFLGKTSSMKFTATSSLLEPQTSRHISYTLSSAEDTSMTYYQVSTRSNAALIHAGVTPYSSNRLNMHVVYFVKYRNCSEFGNIRYSLLMQS